MYFLHNQVLVIYFKKHYRDFNFLEKFAGTGLPNPEGGGLTCYYYGWMEDLIKLETAYNKRLVEHHRISPQCYYTRTIEGGIGSHLRYIPNVDKYDDFGKKGLAVMDEMHAWVHKNFPNIHCPMGNRNVYSDSTGMGDLMEKIREALDPNHIGYRAGEGRLAEEELKEVAA